MDEVVAWRSFRDVNPLGKGFLKYNTTTTENLGKGNVYHLKGWKVFVEGIVTESSSFQKKKARSLFY